MPFTARRVGLVLLVGCLLGVAPVASAQETATGQEPGPEEPMSVRNIDRPSALPPGYLRVDLDADIARQPPDPTGLSGYLGAGIGVLPHLEAGGQFVPLDLTPDFAYTSPTFYALYAFEPAEVFAVIPQVQLTVPVQSGDRWVWDLSAELDLTLSASTELIAAPEVSIAHGDPLGTSVSTPVSLLVQVTDRLFVQPTTGIGLERFDQRFRTVHREQGADFDTVTVPLGAVLGYTLGDARSGMVDLEAQWYWPKLWVPTASNRQVFANDWSVLLSVSVFAPLVDRGPGAG